MAGINVMSATQSWFGAEAEKLRSTRSGAGRLCGSRFVVTTPAASAYALNLKGAHQASNPFSADCLSFGLQLGVDAGDAIGIPRNCVDGSDSLGQLGVRLAPGGWRTRATSVVARLRTPQNPRHRGNRKFGLVRVHELEDPDGITSVLRANQAAAFQDVALLAQLPDFTPQTV